MRPRDDDEAATLRAATPPEAHIRSRVSRSTSATVPLTWEKLLCSVVGSSLESARSWAFSQPSRCWPGLASHRPLRELEAPATNSGLQSITVGPTGRLTMLSPVQDGISTGEAPPSLLCSGNRRGWRPHSNVAAISSTRLAYQMWLKPIRTYFGSGALGFDLSGTKAAPLLIPRR